MRSLPFPVLLVGVLMFALAGCGGGDEEEQPTSVSKVAYVKRADEICKETEKRQRKLLLQFQRENKGAGNSPRVLEEMVTAAALPPLEQQVEELAKLPPPDKEAAKAKAYMAAVEKAVRDIRMEPGTLFAEPGAFTKALELAPEFGFKTCRGA